MRRFVAYLDAILKCIEQFYWFWLNFYVKIFKVCCKKYELFRICVNYYQNIVTFFSHILRMSVKDVIFDDQQKLLL